MSLRVLHLIHDYLPRHQAGSELYVAALCAEMRELGHHPVVFAATFDPSRPQGALEWRTHDGVPVVEVVNNWDAGDFPETYDAAWLQGAFAHVLDAVAPHVVHVHNLLNLAFALPESARARGIPVVATLHDYTLACPSGGQRVHRQESHVCRVIDPDRCARCFGESPFQAQWQFARAARPLPPGPARRLAARLARVPVLSVAARATARMVAGATRQVRVSTADIERRLDAARKAFVHFDHVVAPSSSLAIEYEALGFPAERIEVSDYGFAPMNEPSPVRDGDRRTRIGFMGTLVWHKGADVLLAAARQLPAGQYSIHFHGDERVFPDYTRRLRALAVKLPVEFHGRFEHADVASVLGTLDVLVVPSRWLENSPLVIHEAFMARVPVVASAIGGMPDLLGGGRHGLLVPPDDPPALAAALARLIASPALRRELADNSPAVKTIADDAAEWVARYESLVKSRAAAAS